MKKQNLFKMTALVALSGALMMSGLTACSKGEKAETPSETAAVAADKADAADVKAADDAKADVKAADKQADDAKAADDQADAAKAADDKADAKLTKEELDAKFKVAAHELKFIADGAIGYYQTEHASPDGKEVISKVYPRSDKPVYIPAKAMPANGSLKPDAAEFEAEPWKSLHLEKSDSLSFRYGYIGALDGKSFMLVAQLPSSVEGKCLMTVAIEGSPDGTVSKPQIRALDGDCVEPVIDGRGDIIPGALEDHHGAQEIPVGFKNYVENSKNAEGMENLRFIKMGAIAYYENERCANEECTSLEHNVYPKVDEAVYLPKKEIPAEERVTFDSSEFKAEPWKSLYFSISRPARFRYGYVSSADGKKFTAVAQRRNSDNECITIQITGNDGEVTSPKIVSVGAKCTPAVIPAD